jgi:hypothetical protein
VIDGLFRGQFGDGRQDRESVTSQEDDVVGMSADGRNLGVVDEFERVAGSCVFSDGGAVVVDLSGS